MRTVRSDQSASASHGPPLGRSAADGFNAWLYMLHVAQVFGLPYRVLVSALGLAVAALSVTRVLIWMRKRSARLLKGRERVAAPAGGDKGLARA